MEPHKEQIDRVKRWYDRFREITNGRKHDRPVEFAKDEAYAFFQNCHHLKDWIIQDKAVRIADKKAVAEQFLNESRWLKLCADLCNATKHLVLKRKPRSDERPEFKAAHYGLDVSAGTLSVRFEVSTTSGDKLDAFDLATHCLSEWDRLFRLKREDHTRLRGVAGSHHGRSREGEAWEILKVAVAEEESRTLNLAIETAPHRPARGRGHHHSCAPTSPAASAAPPSQPATSMTSRSVEFQPSIRSR